MLAILLLSQIPSLPKSENSERIGVIYVLKGGGYSIVPYEIDTDCDTWWEENVEYVENNLDPKPYQSWVVHLIKGKVVIGRICNY